MADEENASPPQISVLNIVLNPPASKPTLLLVVPHSLSVIVDSVQIKSTVGEYTFAFRSNAGENEAERATSNESDSDFDDEEQLYSALLSASQKSFKRPIYALGPQMDVFAVVVPHVGDVLAEKMLAQLIGTIAPEKGHWIALAPSTLGYRQILCRLDLGSSEFSEVAPLRPPHYVSGFVAAFVSAMVDKGVEKNGSVFALNSEGQIGFEKVDADSIMAAAHYIAGLLVGEAEKTKYVEKLSRTVRRITLSATSGMYL